MHRAILATCLLVAMAVAAARAEFVPFQRPTEAKDVTDAKGVRAIGYSFGMSMNQTIFLRAPADPKNPPGRPPNCPLDVDNEFKPRGVASVEEWEKARDKIRKAVRAYFGAMPMADLDLEPKIESEQDCEDYTLRTVSYAHSPSQRGKLCLMIPKGLPGPAPAILIYDAWGNQIKAVTGQPLSQEEIDVVKASGTPYTGKATYSRTIGVHLVRQGVVVVALDHWYDQYGKSTRLNTAGAAVHAVTRVINYLETQKELVNPKQIGIFGHVYGAELAQFAMAMEDRLGACAASVSWFDPVVPYTTDYWGAPFWATGYKFAEFTRTAERSSPEMYCSNRKANTNPLPFLTQEMLACMAPRPYLGIQQGLGYGGKSSNTAVIDCIRPVWEVYGKADRVELIEHKWQTNQPVNMRDYVTDFFLRSLAGINPGQCPEDVAKRIVEGLGGDKDKQLGACRLAAWWRCKQAVPGMAKLLASEDAALRRSAAKGLERCGAVEQLLPALTHADPVLRLAVVECLWLHGDGQKQAWKAMAADERDSDPWVKEAKWQALQCNPYE